MTNSQRKAENERKTNETDITISLTIDGEGKYDVSTGVPFIDHMLELMIKHGLMNGTVKATGDTNIDDHHTVEDLGIVLGKTIKDALGNLSGIRRYGNAFVPMDEALAQVSLDISGRPFLIYNVTIDKSSQIKNFDSDLIEDFFQALVAHAGITLHINCPYGRNTHHIIEAVFKAFGRALREAAELDPRVKGVPSTKGSI